jgi:hypothetical protein
MAWNKFAPKQGTVNAGAPIELRANGKLVGTVKPGDIVQVVESNDVNYKIFNAEGAPSPDGTDGPTIYPGKYGYIQVPCDRVTVAVKTRAAGATGSSSVARARDEAEKAFQAAVKAFTPRWLVTGDAAKKIGFVPIDAPEGTAPTSVGFVQSSATVNEWLAIHGNVTLAGFVALENAIQAYRDVRLATVNAAATDGTLTPDMVKGDGTIWAVNSVERSAMSIARGCGIFGDNENGDGPKVRAIFGYSAPVAPVAPVATVPTVPTDQAPAVYPTGEEIRAAAKAAKAATVAA